MRLRWRIAFLVSAAIAISYLDRQTVSVAIAAIERDIPISNIDFSRLQALFLIREILPGGGSGEGLDTSDARPDRTLADDGHQTDLAGSLNVRAAA